MTPGRRSGRTLRRVATWLCLVAGVLAAILVVSEPAPYASVSTSAPQSMAGARAACILSEIELRGAGWPKLVLTVFQQARACGWKRTVAFFAVEWVTRSDEAVTNERGS